MSELKSYTIYEGDVGNYTEHVVYSKSEADEVIAELKDKLQNVSSLLNQTREWLVESQKLHKRCADNAVKVIRHQKYKRCLAMAEWCESMCYWFSARFDHHELVDNVKWELFDRWRLRWAKLADKFKE